MWLTRHAVAPNWCFIDYFFLQHFTFLFLLCSWPSMMGKGPIYWIFYWPINFALFSFQSSGIGEPSVYHALIVIFLEFFAWGLLTMPIINVSYWVTILYIVLNLDCLFLSFTQVLNQTFPSHTFLMNGLVMGIKGILSFLSAPLVGALSDVWGRKFFLLVTVFFTCAPIPLMSINSW